MARIRKVTKIQKGLNVYNEENTERKLDKSIADVNLLNSKKFCIDRNRRILLTLKSYPNLFQSNYFTNNLPPTLRKYSTSTQTIEIDNCTDEEKSCSVSTQTNIWVQKYEICEETRKNGKRKAKSEYSLLKNELNYKNRTHERKATEDCKILDNFSKQHEREEIHNGNIVILHKNENMGKTKVSPPKKNTHPIVKDKRSKNKTNKLKTRARQYKKYNKQFHSHKNNRKFSDNKLEKNEFGNSYLKLFDKMRKCSLAALTWSSKLFRAFSDLGMSLTESFTNIYKYCESQSCQPLNAMCYEYQQRIDNLLWKLNQVENGLNESQNKILEQQKRIDNIDDLDKKINGIISKIESYDSLKSELADLKKLFVSQTESSTTITPPAPPLPPPPPPLPMFSLTTNCSSKTLLKVVQNERKLINYENPRPIITLEDILNVKLKKISVTNI